MEIFRTGQLGTVKTMKETHDWHHEARVDSATQKLAREKFMSTGVKKKGCPIKVITMI